MHVCTCVYTCVCTRQRSLSSTIPQELFIILWRQGLSQNSLIWRSWLASEFQESTSPCLPHTGIKVRMAMPGLSRGAGTQAEALLSLSHLRSPHLGHFKSPAPGHLAYLQLSLHGHTLFQILDSGTHLTTSLCSNCRYLSPVPVTTILVFTSGYI